MRLLVFICFMLVAAAVMAVFSYMAGASLGIIALRVIAVLVVLQAVYFLLLLFVAMLPSPKPKRASADRRATTDPLAETQEQQ